MDPGILILLLFILLIIGIIVYTYILSNDVRILAKRYTDILFNSSSPDIESYSEYHMKPYLDKMSKVDLPSIDNKWNEDTYRFLMYLLALFYSDEQDNKYLNYDQYYQIDYGSCDHLVRLYIIGNIGNIVIRGTSNVDDFGKDCKAIQVNGIHSGFYEIYESIKPKLLALLNDDIDKLYIIGHSLGGAISTLLADDVRKFNPVIYTLATPYVVNKTFVDKISDVTLYRIENEYDEICKMFTTSIVNSDGTIDTYWRPGILVYFESNKNHLSNHQLYTYYDNISNYKILCNM